MYSELKKIIEQAWENRELLSEEPVRQAVRFDSAEPYPIFYKYSER